MPQKRTSISTKELLNKLNLREELRDLNVSDRAKIHQVAVENPKFESLTFENGLSWTDFTGKLVHFSDCDFKGMSFFADIKAEQLTFMNCRFHSLCQFRESNLERLFFFNCTFSEIFTLELSKVKKLNLIQPVTPSEPFSIYGSEIDELAIYRLRQNALIQISGQNSYLNQTSTTDNKIEITPGIDKLHINFDQSFSGELNIEDLSIKNIHVSGKNNSGTLTFSNIKSNHISVRNFENLGTINLFSLNSTEDDAEITLANSNLGKTHLYNIDFFVFEVRIENSNIQELVPSNVKWCEKVKTETKKNLKDLSADRREVYRQLKNVMIKSNNKPEELHFHSLEMTNYRLLLKEDKERKLDRAILRLNKISNNHGLNPLKALCWTLAISTTFYATNQVLLGNYLQITVASTFKSIQEVLELINPVRKFTDVYSTSLDSNNWQLSLAKILDNIFKVISSYLIFQFITAFRKFVRK